MAKIQLKENGLYEFWVDLGRDPATGKRRQVHRSGFKTKKAANDEIRRLQNEADSGIYVKKQKATITFAEFADMWFEHYQVTSGCKSSTIEARKNSISSLKKRIGNVRMSDFTKQRYEKLLADLDDKYAKNTFKAMHIVMDMIFKYAVECNLLASNPAAGAKKPKKAKTIAEIDSDIQEKYLSKDELTHLLAVIKDYGDLQYYALFRLLAFSGMRIGEVLGLEVSKIDFDASQIKVRQTYCNDTNGVKDYYLQTPKTDTSIRDIDIDVETLAILHMWISEQKQNKMRKRNVWHDDHEFVFTSVTYPGYPMSYHTARQMLKKFFEVARLNADFSPHTLRHTHASLLAESGATLEQIQERLGHANDDLTRQIYLHVTKDSKANMMAQFASFMKV